VRAGLAELLRREVLEISADPLSPQRGEYRFAQQLLRQVAYDTLSRRDRKTRHLAVAAHLRATFADDGEEVSDAIARHYRDALTAAPDDPDAGEICDQAVRIGVRAADRANRAGAPATAGALFAMAAELAEQGGADAGEAAGWWEKAAVAAKRADDADACIERAGRANVLHAAAGRERDAARTVALIGNMLANRGQLTSGRERLEAALAVLSAEPDADTVTALMYLGQIENSSGANWSQTYTAQALKLGQDLDVGDATLTQLFTSQGVAFAILDRRAEAAAALEYAARLSARAGDREGEAKALVNLADALAPRDPRASADAARTATDLSRQVGARRMLAFAMSNLAEALLTIGEWEEALSVLRGGNERDGLGTEDITQLVLARALALRGDIGATRQLLDTGLDRFRASEDPQDLSAVQLIEGLMAAATGDDAAALEHARAAADYERELGFGAESVRWAWVLAARSAHNVGDVAAEQKLLDALDQHPVGRLPLVLRAERDLVRARLTSGADDQVAAQLFERAIEAHRKIPALFNLAHALLDHAELLAAAGDRAGADVAVTEAAQIADRLGAKPLARRAAAASRTTVG
jgi:tetratricopeptide (TPR) repeat protein